MSGREQYPQLHLRLTPDLQAAIAQIRSRLEAEPGVRTLTRRKGKISDAACVRFALGESSERPEP